MTHTYLDFIPSRIIWTLMAPFCMGVWAAVGVGVAGIAANAYGANKQAKAAKAASAENADSLAAQNAAAWSNYLMTRGLNPAGAVTGQIPQNAQAINSRLPLWATANFKTPGGGSKWVKKGTLPAPNTLSHTPVAPVAAPAAAAPAGTPSSGSSRTKDFLIGNPLGIGGKDRNFFDPLGIF